MESNVAIDCSESVYIDNAFIGTLLLFLWFLNEDVYRLVYAMLGKGLSVLKVE